LSKRGYEPGHSSTFNGRGVGGSAVRALNQQRAYRFAERRSKKASAGISTLPLNLRASRNSPSPISRGMRQPVLTEKNNALKAKCGRGLF
jgi:hypothetical protein